MAALREDDAALWPDQDDAAGVSEWTLQELCLRAPALLIYHPILYFFTASQRFLLPTAF